MGQNEPQRPHPLASLSRPSQPQAAASAPHFYANSAPYSPLPFRTNSTGPQPSRPVHSPEANLAPLASGTAQGPSVKRARLSGAAGGSDDEDATAEGKKRSRQALSCSSCKRKKIKCDRKIPCIACIKRNKPHECTWEEARIEPEPQLFALSADLRKVTGRLAQVEQFLQTLPPELRAGAPKPQLLSPHSAADPTPHGLYSPDRSDLSIIRDGEPTSDTEEAAINLEATAFGSQAGVAQQFRYNTADSLPFLDTTSPKSVPTYRTELTRELTSIVSSPVDPDALMSYGIQLGCDFGATVEDVEAAKRVAIRKALAGLPSKEVSYFLVEKYFLEFSWIHYVIHRTSFDAELDRFWEMCEANKGQDVDPIWLALYSIVLAISLDGIRSRPVAPRDEPPVNAPADQPLQWFAAAQRFLSLGDWLGAPQARSIMTVILLGQYVQIASFGGQANRFLTWLASAIRIAQILGLHQLGDNPESMPPDDPCFPPGKNSVKREGALRIFGALVFMDWLFANFPSSFADSQLIQAHRPHLQYAKHTIATQSRHVFDKLVSESRNFSYEIVLELDRGYRQILDSLPDDWKLERTEIEKRSPQLRWKRHICQEGLHSRIVRLHRPFMTRGYTESSRFSFSTQQCVASAKVNIVLRCFRVDKRFRIDRKLILPLYNKIVIATHHNILDVTNNVWFLYNHALGAAIVLFCDLFHAIDSDYSQAETENKKETLVTAFEIFGRHESISSPVLRAVVQQGARILSGLFMAVEKRRVTRAALTLTNGGEAKASIESFAQVLQRISRDLDFKPPSPSAVQPSTQPNFEQQVVAPLPFPQGTGTNTPFEGQNYEQLSSMFFQDLGMPAGGDSGHNFWAHATPPMSNDALVTCVTPPEAYSFLGTHVDWNNIGINQQPMGAPLGTNSLAATALLDQFSLPW
ncbi:hypothetical protein P7C70_g726, partial [Phenoliferia sp. Uapishka_3]